MSERGKYCKRLMAILTQGACGLVNFFALSLPFGGAYGLVLFFFHSSRLICSSGSVRHTITYSPCFTCSELDNDLVSTPVEAMDDWAHDLSCNKGIWFQDHRKRVTQPQNMASGCGGNQINIPTMYSRARARWIG